MNLKNEAFRMSCAILGLWMVLTWSSPSASQEPAESELSKPVQDRFVEAAWRGDRSQIEQLLKDPDVIIDNVSSIKLTAWQAAKIRGYHELAKLLESKGASPNDAFDPGSVAQAILRERFPDQEPGIAVRVGRGSDVLLQESLGLANVKPPTPVIPETKFRIGSVTKPFTAACVLKLQDAGQLSVDDRLDKYLPDFPRGDEVTLHHLLTHTSGIHNFTNKPDFLKTVTTPTPTLAMIDSFMDDPYDFDPGANWSYSNSGYYLLGYIVEQVSGKSFDEYLRETFFEPLEMHNTGVHRSTVTREHEATGYAYEDGQVVESLNWDMSRAGAAGNLYSTVGDLHRWNVGVLMGDALSTESRASALTPVSLPSDERQANYGYGWVVNDYRGIKKIEHSGGLEGFRSGLAFFPDQQFTIAVLRNASGGSPHQSLEQVSDMLADLYLWQSLERRSEESTDVDVSTFSDYVGRYRYGPGAILIVTLKDQQLSAQLTGQPQFPIFPRGDDTFFWKVVDAQVKFRRDELGKVKSARHTQNGVTFDASRLDDAKTVDVPVEILDKYVGKYSYGLLSKLTVRREGNSLFAKMTGQQEFQIFPKSEHQFFWKVVEAEIEFVSGDDGAVQNVIHRQGGQTIEAPRVAPP